MDVNFGTMTMEWPDAEPQGGHTTGMGSTGSLPSSQLTNGSLLVKVHDVRGAVMLEVSLALHSLLLLPRLPPHSLSMALLQLLSTAHTSTTLIFNQPAPTPATPLTLPPPHTPPPTHF